MKSLPFFASHQSLMHGPRWANQNDDYLPRARHWPVWPRDRWPSFARFLEANAHVFLMDLLNLLQADEGDELFRTVQEQQTEFTPLPRHWDCWISSDKVRPLLHALMPLQVAIC
mmetsp:Transcript_78792/g.225732  ORF Transcript_78792/g.225732 Transcript_78792/m.225732 type:complete len:114 (-) Transcript_78792:328-669(-)